ncbi:2-oxo acid dehydrogenase subunit E2 [Patescibacteria group bacterium]|nr:2-oxo acid dehydrogenase subunit E2 [Patescibacteria group bacterium]MBU1703228.1 2-oxo acid dehydrogenase subunit E2 [Patescibacteria group bacterium]MBU1953844.1 2-oxo acid dehydrogenase subunit E2 [Patescibacteria group bacterium]
MAYEFKFPDVGEGIHEGKVVKWLVKEGDLVKADDTIAEVETDKAVVEIPSPKSGKILKITHAEGDTIKVGDVLATIEESGGGEGSAVSGGSAEKRESTGVVGELGKMALGVMKVPSMAASGAVFAGQEPAGAAAKKVEKSPVKDITKAVIEEEKAKAGGVNAIKAGLKAVKKYDMFGYVDRIPYDGVRKAIGDHMVKSMFTIPHVTHTDLADVTDLFALREKEKVKAEKDGIKLTFLPYFIKAVIAGLQKHPSLNSSLDEDEGQIILKKYYNIGIAVDTEHGLMVPVIKRAEGKSIIDLAREIGDLAQKARDRKLNAMDMKGGTFTITNIGSAGSGWFATPVINFPEAAILGTGMIQDMAAVMPVKAGTKAGGKAGAPGGAGAIVARKMLPLSCAFDHRILDGAEAARFTKTVKEFLEDPKILVGL